MWPSMPGRRLRSASRTPRTSAGPEPNGEEAKAWPSTSGSASATPGTLPTRSVTAS